MKPYEKFTLREEVNPVALEDEERHALYGLAQAHAQQKRRRWPKVAATAAAVLILLGGVSPTVRATVGRVAEQVQVSFSEAFGGSAEGNKMAVKLHETVVLGDEEFVVEDILPMGNALYLTTLYPRGEVPLDNSLQAVYVNGEKLQVVGTGGTRQDRLEDGVVLEALRVSLDKPLPEADMWEMELVYRGSHGAKATVATTVDPQVLKEHAVQLANDYAIPGAEGFVLQDFVMTPAVQVGVLEVPGELYDNGDWHLEAVDTEGHVAHITWVSGRLDRERQVGVIDISFSPVVSTMTADEFLAAPELTWTLYGRVNEEDGQRNHGEWVQVGESFVLKNPQGVTAP